MISHYCFICGFPTIRDIEHIFMCLLAICMSSLEKSLFRFFCSSFHCTVRFFDFELYEVFIYFLYWPLFCHIICKYFLPFSRLPFRFFFLFLFFFCCANAFSLIRFNLFTFAFIYFAVGDVSKNIAAIYVKEYSTNILS